MPTISAAAQVGGAPDLVNVGDEVAYVSLAPGTVPAGAIATIRRVGDAGSFFTTVRDGGFDPVAIGAQVGDSIEVVVRDNADATVGVSGLTVRATRPPVVVRTDPPRKKRDVPVNAAIVIVFSEPIAPATLSSSVQLFHGPFQVAGNARLLQGTGSAVAFTPAAQLAPNTPYRLVVTDAVADLDGNALEAGVSVIFTTGASFAGPGATLDVSPDTVFMTGGTYQMTATVRDAAGNLLLNEPIRWSTSAPELTVSSTGLLTALADGYYDVSATADTLQAHALVLVALGGPPATLEVSPTTAAVAASDTIILTATVRDAAGRAINRPVTWTSSDSAVAVPLGGGLVSGVTQGSVTISATSETASGTATVTVGPPKPVASVMVTPDLATLIPQGTVQLTATLRDASGRAIGGRSVAWSSDNPAVVTVNASGFVTAVDVGSATVTATSEGLSDTAVVTVTMISFASVNAGGGHACGRAPAGAAYCWGDNSNGQLGDGSTSASLAPVAVTGGLGFAALSVGSNHNCGLQASGAAYCWGTGVDGRLGDGTFSSSSAPVIVSGGLAFTALSAGGFHTCGLATNGAAYCWGNNLFGQLGNGSTIPSAVPVAVTGGLTFAALTVGGWYTCGLTPNGEAYCWGRNVFGELGNGSMNASPVPVAVAGGLAFATVSAGGHHTCGLTTNGAAHCWGSNGWGELGNRSFGSSPVPVAVNGGLVLAALSAGDSHTCARTSNGETYCWGRNQWGELGNGSTGFSDVPVAVTGGVAFSTLSAGVAHTCGMSTAAIAYCWGLNADGRLGNGSTTNSSTPFRVAGQP